MTSEKREKWCKIERKGDALRPLSVLKQEREPRPMEARVLVVDDSKIAYLAVKNTLEREGIEVLWARDGAEALNRMKAEKVDLVFVDVFLPGENGVDLIRQMRSLFPNVPVAVLSSYVDKELILSAVKAGAIDYILKPFKREYLLERVKRIILGEKVRVVQFSPQKLEELEITLKFEDIVRKEVKRCSRAGGHFCVMYAKFPSFVKNFDELKEFLRETDFVIPVSANEILFVLTLTGKNGVTAVVRRTKERIREDFTYAFVCYPDDGKNADEIISSLKEKIRQEGIKA